MGTFSGCSAVRAKMARCTVGARPVAVTRYLAARHVAIKARRSGRQPHVPVAADCCQEAATVDVRRRPGGWTWASVGWMAEGSTIRRVDEQRGSARDEYVAALQGRLWK